MSRPQARLSGQSILGYSSPFSSAISTCASADSSSCCAPAIAQHPTGRRILRDAVINSKWVTTPLLDVVDVLECNGLGSAKYRTLLRVEFAEEVRGSIYLTDLRPSFQAIFQRPTPYLLL